MVKHKMQVITYKNSPSTDTLGNQSHGMTLKVEMLKLVNIRLDETHSC